MPKPPFCWRWRTQDFLRWKINNMLLKCSRIYLHYCSKWHIAIYLLRTLWFTHFQTEDFPFTDCLSPNSLSESGSCVRPSLCIYWLAQLWTLRQGVRILKEKKRQQENWALLWLSVIAQWLAHLLEVPGSIPVCSEEFSVSEHALLNVVAGYGSWKPGILSHLLRMYVTNSQIEVQRFTENPMHRCRLGSVHDSVFLHFRFDFGSIPFIRSFLVPLWQKKWKRKKKKSRKKKSIKNWICHFCKIVRFQFYSFLESSYLIIVFLSCNQFINFTFINTRAACLPKWLTMKLRMLPRSLNQEFGSTSALKTSFDNNGIRTVDKSKTVCKECRAQISYGTGNTANMFTHLQRN